MEPISTNPGTLRLVPPNSAPTASASSEAVLRAAAPEVIAKEDEGETSLPPRRAPAGSVIAPPAAYYWSTRKLKKGTGHALDQAVASRTEEVGKLKGFDNRLTRALKKANKEKKWFFIKRKREEITKAVATAKADHESSVKTEAKARAQRQMVKQAPWGAVVKEYGTSGAVAAAGWTAVASGYRNVKAVRKGQKSAGTAAIDLLQDVSISGVAGATACIVAGLLGSKVWGASKLYRVGAALTGYFGSAAVSALVAEGLDKAALKMRGIKT